MKSGNLVEREAGRDKFVTATLIAKHGEGRDPGEDIPSLAELPAPTAQVVEIIRGNEPAAPTALAVETSSNNDPAGPTVQCVKISCLNDLLEGEEKFIAVAVPATDDRFQCIPTEFSMSMDLPLIVYVSVTMPERARDPHGLMNPTGAYFYRPVNPEKPDFGFYPVWVKTMMSIGTVLVMRHDKKDITVKQVQAIAHYIRYHWDEEYRLLTRMACNKRERKVLRRERRAFIEDKLSRAAFETFFRDFKQSRGHGDRSWLKEISPYEV